MNSEPPIGSKRGALWRRAVWLALVSMLFLAGSPAQAASPLVPLDVALQAAKAGGAQPDDDQDLLRANAEIAFTSSTRRDSGPTASTPNPQALALAKPGVAWSAPGLADRGATHAPAPRQGVLQGGYPRAPPAATGNLRTAA